MIRKCRQAGIIIFSPFLSMIAVSCDSKWKSIENIIVTSDSFIKGVDISSYAEVIE
ncbi:MULTISPECIES: hypothetical protein [Mesoplasma]|uniref:hypothetical protein n=1 Tax=Mesoplasma TaxID=46239 RepID=UPI000A69626A|nr:MULTISPECIES: hypothetical protein [Mesoplasma]